MTYTLNNKSLLFKYISYNLNNLYDSNLTVSDVYSLDLAKCIYSFLSDYFPPQPLNDPKDSGDTETVNISKYYLQKAKILNKVEQADLSIIQNQQLPVYDYDHPVTPEDISDINKYNIYTWNIDDSILQYLQPGVVISELNTVDEIAQAQISLDSLGYSADCIGTLDSNFYNFCYDIQTKLKRSNPNVIQTGYYDIYVESYARLMAEPN